MIVGVDLSTFAVHTGWMAHGQACRWHVELGNRHVHLIDRVRACHLQWPLDVSDVVVEMPYGPNRRTQVGLNAVLGAITRSVPKQARCSWISSGDLRRAIGARDNKDSAHYELRKRVPERMLEGWDEHELDSLVTCLGFTQILSLQEEAS